MREHRWISSSICMCLYTVCVCASVPECKLVSFPVHRSAKWYSGFSTTTVIAQYNQQTGPFLHRELEWNNGKTFQEGSVHFQVRISKQWSWMRKQNKEQSSVARHTYLKTPVISYRNPHIYISKSFIHHHLTLSKYVYAIFSRDPSMGTFISTNECSQLSTYFV